MRVNLADLELEARRAAEEAARREGVSLEEWLTDAIEDQPSPPRRVIAAVRSKPAGGAPTGGEGTNPFSWTPNVTAPSRNPIGLRRSRGSNAGSRSENGARSAHSKSIALALERTQTPSGQASVAPAPSAEPEPVALRDIRVDRSEEPRGPIATVDKASAPAKEEQGLPAPIAVGDPRVTTAPSTPATIGEPASTRPDKRQRDLNAAVSEIALRRRQLDARSAAAGHAQAQVDPPPPAPGAAAAEQHDDLRALIRRIEELGRKESEDKVSAAEISAMRAEIAGMIQSLADLAPRNAVVALEGAVRDLSERVAVLRQNGDVDQLLTPLEAMASELRAAIRAYDPQVAAAALEREIHAIGGKIDGLAETAISPQTFERILRQTEEVRSLLSAAANRSLPLEQFERRIEALADRVEAWRESRPANGMRADGRVAGGIAPRN